MEKDIIRLFEGYQQFHAQHFEDENSPFAKLVRKGQRPKVLMIACSDSRVDPALIMNCEPGELFVIRNVANLVPPYECDQSYHGTSAALEFGVCVLGVRHIILLGHTQCGGMQTLISPSPEVHTEKSFLTKWMELAQEAREKALQAPGELETDERVNVCGHYSLVHSLENLKTFPWIAEKVKEGTLALHAWNFDMEQGILEEYAPATQSFRPLQNPADLPSPLLSEPKESPGFETPPEQQSLF